MEKILSLKQLESVCDGSLFNCDKEVFVTDVITDSRKITPGSVFVALRGEKFDGHTFTKSAIESGAVCCVVDRSFDNPDGLPVLMVKDTYEALRSIAMEYRACFSVPSIAITGSVGKTSTKDMISKVLETQFEVLKTEGNFNNEIGLPLTVFRMEKKHNIAVFEMGMSNFGEISRLTKITKPDVAVLTNIGFCHIEFLGSRENILKAKLEILEGLSADGMVVLNGDDPYLKEVVGKIPFETLTYGVENADCDIVARNLIKHSWGTEFEADFMGQIWNATINVPGEHHVYNALAAMLVGMIYEIPSDKIIHGVGDFVPSGMRQNILELCDRILIKDCYNASPTSMKSGLDVLSMTEPKDKDKPYRKVAVLGDMLELGEYSAEAHKDLGKLCLQYDLDCLIAVGDMGELVKEGAKSLGFNPENIYVFKSSIEANEHIMKLLRANDIVLFKGSRGVHLEVIADFVAQQLPEN